MQITLTPEQQTQVTRIAAAEGKDADVFLQEILNRALAEEADYIAAIQVGVDAADRGDFVDTAEVWERIERKFRS